MISERDIQSLCTQTGIINRRGSALLSRIMGKQNFGIIYSPMLTKIRNLISFPSKIIFITKTCYKLTSTCELTAQISTNYETTLFAPNDKMQTRNSV